MKIYMVSLFHRATIKETTGQRYNAPLLHRAAITSWVLFWPMVYRMTYLFVYSFLHMTLNIAKLQKGSNNMWKLGYTVTPTITQLNTIKHENYVSVIILFSDLSDQQWHWPMAEFLRHPVETCDNIAILCELWSAMCDRRSLRRRAVYSSYVIQVNTACSLLAAALCTVGFNRVVHPALRRIQVSR